MLYCQWLERGVVCKRVLVRVSALCIEYASLTLDRKGTKRKTVRGNRNLSYCINI